MSETRANDTGERTLLINKNALGRLACTSEHMASKVSMLLLNALASSAAESHTSPLAASGAIRPVFVEAFVSPLVMARDSSFANFGVRYDPRLPRLPGGPRTLMEPDEKPWGVRLDDEGYYRIAKDEASAHHIQRDGPPVRELERRIRLGLEPGLTIISEDGLVPPEPQFDAPHYTQPIDIHAARKIDAQVRRDALELRLPAHTNWADRQVGGFNSFEFDITRTLAHIVFPREIGRPAF